MNTAVTVMDVSRQPGEPTKSLSSKTLYLFLQITVVVGAFYDAIEFIKPEVSTANLNVIDLLLSAVYLVWLSLVIRGKIGLPRFSRNKALYVFILILLVPIFVGFMQGHVWQTVMRDARAPYYFILSLVVISFTTNEKAMKKLFSTFLVVGSICLVFDYLVFIFRIPIATNLAFSLLTTGRATRHFGYHSSHMLLLVCIMFLINYLFISRARKSVKAIAFAALVAFVLGLCLTLIRGFFIGMILGSTAAILIQKDKKKVLAVFATGLLVVCLGFLFLAISPDAMTAAAKIPVVERYMSILNPSASSEEAANTAKARIDAVPRAQKGIAEHPFFGMGYGEYRRARDEGDLVDPILPFLSHSTPSYMLYRTGYVGASVLLYCLIVFAASGYTFFVRSPEHSASRLAYGTACASLVAICIGSLGANMIFGSDRFSPLVAIVVGLLLSRVRSTETNPSLDNTQRQPKPSWTAAPPPKSP